MGTEELHDKQSSIEVDRNGKGEYAFHVKIYFNEEERTTADVIQEIRNAYANLISQFLK
jgi:hypothetical protein